MKRLAQIIAKSLCGAVPGMIMFFRLIFHNPISYSVFTKCKMVAEIADCVKSFNIDPENNNEMNVNQNNFVLYYKLASEV